MSIRPLLSGRTRIPLCGLCALFFETAAVRSLFLKTQDGSPPCAVVCSSVSIFLQLIPRETGTLFRFRYRFFRAVNQELGLRVLDAARNVTRPLEMLPCFFFLSLLNR